jgi:hypothetical protein
LLGAGIHNLHQATTAEQFEAKRLLSSWGWLLRELGGNDVPGLSPTIKWEFMALEDDTESVAPASKREKMLRKMIQERVQRAEKIVIDASNSANENADLKRILLSPMVTDVISLNIDLLIERLASGRMTLPKVVRTDETSIERRREISRPNGAEALRVWHPHGDYESAETLSFGLWRYEQLLGPMKKARSSLKESEKKDRYDVIRTRVAKTPSNWVELMMLRPLVIVGTSLNEAEWDIWYALLMRWRNFAKSENRQHELPIYLLRAESETSDPASLRLLHSNRFKILSAPDWRTAWRWLADAVGGVSESAVAARP